MYRNLCEYVDEGFVLHAPESVNVSVNARERERESECAICFCFSFNAVGPNESA